MFSKVLIANRGAIATRIVRTLRKLGIKAVAVYAESDRESLHVSRADEAFPLGEGGAAQTYLNQDLILEIAQKTGAEAVHPGCGFLSENADFAARCEQAGIAFVGPTAEQIRAFGRKHSARALAREFGVPLLPGTELLQSPTDAVEAAERLGYPIIVKSTAGGGGIGMQSCENRNELLHAYDAVKRLGEANFSDAGLYLERYVPRGRHIEVQVFGDGKGGVVSLGDRDCSTQRRHQKILEEAPAPGIRPAVREQLHSIACRLMAGVKYRNAGTVEFIYDPESEDFYFLEVNTRLQVEHGITEAIYDLDLVEWMLMLAAQELPPLQPLRAALKARGHAFQARVYAEDPSKSFQPSAGTLTRVEIRSREHQRIDHWIETGLEISPFFDPLLAKVIAHSESRSEAIAGLIRALEDLNIDGIETNIGFLCAVLRSENFQFARHHTRMLDGFRYQPATLDVLRGGTNTTVQDAPGRLNYWGVGIPPSGPFDDWSFRLGNALLGNAPDAAGLEVTLAGPKLRFNIDAQVIVTGAEIPVLLDSQKKALWEPFLIQAGQVLDLGKISGLGARAYLLIKGGLQGPLYLGSRATFTLGQFGGLRGKALTIGDVLKIPHDPGFSERSACPLELRPVFAEAVSLRVMVGPHAAPDFLTEADLEMLFEARWEVHYNSSRTGLRLIGPKPQWARRDGGEAGLHPSNIHDNAYAPGTVDFTGDMPVILGPDGPSLGGFVCPLTVISADRWRLGQLKAGNIVTFQAVSAAEAEAISGAQERTLAELKSQPVIELGEERESPVIGQMQTGTAAVIYRQAGDRHILVEYGLPRLDLRTRFRVHALMLALEERAIPGILDITPGIRSLQVHFDPQRLARPKLLDQLLRIEVSLTETLPRKVPSRIVHLPLSWDDPACQEAIAKYMQVVRKDAPWCPSNLEFIRRINGLASIDQVREIVFSAEYLVMGLGDVYLGAPVATPVDPRHRLVTTKYNPARTWTAENSVGIGGAYLCIYGVEGPGGYQFVGRTLQVWNRYRATAEFSKPWLLRHFDRIKFYPVSHDELMVMRRDFPLGRHSLKIEEGEFDIDRYDEFLKREANSIREFRVRREQAFAQELENWHAAGQFVHASDSMPQAEPDTALGEGLIGVESPVAGNIWKILVEVGDMVLPGAVVAVAESMKTEIDVVSDSAGIVVAISRPEGSTVRAGQVVVTLKEQDNA